jgi:hypothetical protein
MASKAVPFLLSWLTIVRLVSAAIGAALVLTVSCGGVGTPPLANHVERSFDVVVVGDPAMQDPVRVEITRWLRHRGYVAAQIRQTPLLGDELAKLTQCLTEELTGSTLGCLMDAYVRLTADRHLVIARVTRRPDDTRTLDLVLAWLGDGSSTIAPVCRTPCSDSSWQSALTAELEHAAPLLEMGSQPSRPGRVMARVATRTALTIIRP